ncbi:MAG TPA: putative porin [Thermoanaerobaculia bacterium]|nr:putative porin [Thermoanaerobaculia bacterium]
MTERGRVGIPGAAVAVMFVLAGAAAGQDAVANVGAAPPKTVTAAAASDDVFQPLPAPGSRFEFLWDALVRYDVIEISKQAPVGDIHRWRTEVRPEVDWLASDRFRLGVRLVGDLGSDSNRTNAARLDNYRSNGVGLDRAYVEARPGAFLFMGGQYGMPFRTSEMFWDHDIQVIGASGAWRIPLGGMSAFTVAGGFFYGPQRQHDESHIAAGQATFETGDPAAVAFDISGSYWRFTHLHETGEHWLRQNIPAYALPGYSPPSPYANDFRIVDALARLRILGAHRFPVSLSVDWARNLAAHSEYRDGVEAALRVGREGAPGDVEIFDIYQYVDRDAVVGAYNTDDWWFHSWYVGHRVGVSVTVLPQVMLRPSVVFQRRQDREHYLNRYLLDLVKTF